MASRRPRRPLVDAPADPLALPLHEAAEIERSAGWGTPDGSCAFWRRPDVPAELRAAAEPDPRVVLALDSAGVLAFHERVAAFESARDAWLVEVTRRAGER